MTAEQTAGAYEPRPGDRVTVRRYNAPTIGERTLEHVHTGTLTEVTPHADGYFIRLDTVPERIFTGYQFLGAGTDGRSPSSLVTEVTPAVPGEGVFGRLLSPDALLAVDGSGCIVLVVTESAGKLLRKITVTNVDEWKAGLDDAREAQHIALEEADQHRALGTDERRKARGDMTQSEAVAHLTQVCRVRRSIAIGVTQRARAYKHLGSPERVSAGKNTFIVSYTDDGYWRVVSAATTEQPAR